MNPGSALSRRWLDQPLWVKGLLALILPISVLVLGVMLALLAGRVERAYEARVNHSLEVQRVLNRLHLAAVEATARHRAFMLTGDTQLLDFYQAELEAARVAQRQLNQLLGDSIDQLARVQRIRALIDQLGKISQVGTLALRDGQANREALSKVTLQQRQLLDQIRTTLTEARTEEQRRLVERRALDRRYRTLEVWVLSLALVFGVLGGVLANLLLSNGIVRRVRRLGQNARRLAQGQPPLPIPLAGDELGQLAQTQLETHTLLQAEQNRVRRALAGGDLVLFEYDQKTEQINFVSEPWQAESSGFATTELPPTLESWFNSFHPDDQPRLRTAWTALLEEDTPLDLEVRRVRPDNRMIWRELRARQYGDRVLGTSANITARKEAESALEHERRLNQDIIQNSPASIYFKDLSGRYLLVNAQQELLLNRSKAELVGKTDFELFPAETAQTFQENDRLVLEAGQPLTLEESGQLPDGSLHTYLSVKFPLRSQTGEVYGVGGISSDITQRKQAQAELERQRDLMQAILDNTPAAVYLKDRAGRYLLTNRTHDLVMGFPMGHVIGKTASDVLPAEQAGVFARQDDQVLIRQEVMVFEEAIHHFDGSQHIYLSTKFPLFTTSGEVYAVCGVSTDITERKHLEENLRKSEQLYRTLAQNFPRGAVAIFDHQLRFLMAEGQGLSSLGLHTTKVEGRALIEVLPERAPELEPLYRQVLAGESFSYEVSSSRNGRFYQVHYVPLLEDGGVWGGLIVTYDISEIKSAEAAAQQANRAKSEFLSRMSHELRTPMNAILGFGQLLQMENPTPAQQESIEQILKAGRHLLQLINEVLDISRIEAGRLAFSLEPISLDEALRECLDLVRPLAEARRIGLVLEGLDGCHPIIQADRQRLKQVLLNLLSNAIKYNRDGGKVILFCQEMPHQMLRLCVRDTGPGIAPELLAQLFTPFERLGADRLGLEGSGLGLVLSRRLTEAMQGQLGVESQVGEGSTFWIELPLAVGTLQSGDASSLTPTALDGLTGNHRLLYIEDNLSNLRLVKRLLSRWPGVSLLTAMQGQLGLELALSQPPDLILLDLHLPDLPGQEVLARLKAHPQTRAIPVIVLSADASDHQIERLLTQGATAYLTKPLDLEAFYRVLRKALGGSSEQTLNPPA
ncbi:MAG: PAS domain-containing protein [Thermaceae bacterium]|nr:PAS domain-containing protein [Thermaceae bacterium]